MAEELIEAEETIKSLQQLLDAKDKRIAIMQEHIEVLNTLVELTKKKIK